MGQATPRRVSDQCEVSATRGAKVAAALKPIRIWAAEKRISEEVSDPSAKPSDRPIALRIAATTMPRRATMRPTITPPAKKPSVFMVYAKEMSERLVPKAVERKRTR